MMKKLIIFSLWLLSFVPVQAQTIYFNNKAQAYEYYAKNAAIKFLDLYMHAVMNSKKERDGYNAFHDKFIKGKKYNNLEELRTAIDSIKTFLPKKSWGTTKKYFEKLDSLINSNINNKQYNLDAVFNNAYFTYKIKTKKNKNFSLAFNTNNADKAKKIWIDRLKNLQKSINNKYKATLEKLKESNSDNKQDGDSVDRSNNENITESNNSVRPLSHHNGTASKSQPRPDINNNSGSLFGELVGFLWKILLGFILGLLFVHAKIKKILHLEYDKYVGESTYKISDIIPSIKVIRRLKERKDEEKRKNENSTKDFENTNHNNLKKIKRLEEEKQRLEKENKKLLTELNKYRQNPTRDSYINQTSNAPNLSSTSVPIQTSKPKMVEYYGIPEPDGSFLVEQARTHPDRLTFYKIEFEEGSREGTISYILDPNHDGRAINRYNTTLNPVCDIENLSMRDTANYIEIKASGKVTLIDNKWHIKQGHKIKIKFV